MSLTNAKGAAFALSPSGQSLAAVDANEAAAWAVLQTVLDPEVPALSVCDLGIVRAVKRQAAGLHVVLTPTYSGCPATEVIEQDIRSALVSAGLGPVTITQQLAPAWTSDWITPEGHNKLRAYGIAPPSGQAAVALHEAAQHTISIRPRNVACPWCNSVQTERLSAFGATACKALHRCLSCREPFEHFKTI